MDRGFPSTPEEEERPILGASLHIKAGDVDKKASEESQESSFHVGGKGEQAEGGEKNGNEGGNLFPQPLCDMSAGDHFLYDFTLLWF